MKSLLLPFTNSNNNFQSFVLERTEILIKTTTFLSRHTFESTYSRHYRVSISSRSLSDAILILDQTAITASTLAPYRAQPTEHLPSPRQQVRDLHSFKTAHSLEDGRQSLPTLGDPISRPSSTSTQNSTLHHSASLPQLPGLSALASIASSSNSPQLRYVLEVGRCKRISIGSRGACRCWPWVWKGAHQCAMAGWTITGRPYQNSLLVVHCSNTIWTFPLALLCCYSMTQRIEEPG